MSDPSSFEFQVVRELNQQRQQFSKQVGDIPAIYLFPYPLLTIPVVAAASPADFAFTNQPWACRLLASYVSVYIQPTNNALNYWTVDIFDVPGTTLYSQNTSALAAGAWARLPITINNQPATTSIRFYYRLTATGAPGEIYVVPTLAVLRTG